MTSTERVGKPSSTTVGHGTCFSCGAHQYIYADGKGGFLMVVHPREGSAEICEGSEKSPFVYWLDKDKKR